MSIADPFRSPPMNELVDSPLGHDGNLGIPGSPLETDGNLNIPGSPLEIDGNISADSENSADGNVTAE